MYLKKTTLACVILIGIVNRYDTLYLFCLCQVWIKWIQVLLKCHFPSFYMLLFFLRIHSLYILVIEGILENSCVLLGSKLFCSKFDQKSTPPLIEIFLVLCLFAEGHIFRALFTNGKFILSYLIMCCFHICLH